MKQNEIIDFFNEMAPTWDAHTIRNEAAIQDILDAGGVKAGVRVLDIACGTGVLFPDYLNRNVASVLGCDIAPEMLRIAKENFKAEPSISYLCADAQTFSFSQVFDCIMIHNAFPHFAHPELLFSNLSACLAAGGRLTVAHSMSREAIQNCHAGKPQHVSKPLPTATALAQTMSEFLNVDVVVSDAQKYIVSGTRF